MSDDETLAAWHAGELGTLAERRLAPLIGEPFQTMGRAADMIWTGFGPRVDAPTPRDPHRRVPRYALHIQCPFRLDCMTGTVVASFDVYHSSDDPYSREPFDTDQRTSVFDEAIAGLWRDNERGFVAVERVEADRYGGLKIEMSQGYAIKLFPNFSRPREHWRFFAFDSDDDHLVVVPEPDALAQ